jgi:hypothetical protein
MIAAVRQRIATKARLSVCFCRLVLETVRLPSSELVRRTWREVVDDDVLGLAAQLSYSFFLALFPLIGARAARAFRDRQRSGGLAPEKRVLAPTPAAPPKPALGATVAAAILITKWWHRRHDSAKSTESARAS